MHACLLTSPFFTLPSNYPFLITSALPACTRPSRAPSPPARASSAICPLTAPWHALPRPTSDPLAQAAPFCGLPFFPPGTPVSERVAMQCYSLQSRETAGSFTKSRRGGRAKQEGMGGAEGREAGRHGCHTRKCRRQGRDETRHERQGLGREGAAKTQAARWMGRLKGGEGRGNDQATKCEWTGRTKRETRKNGRQGRQRYTARLPAGRWFLPAGGEGGSGREGAGGAARGRRRPCLSWGGARHGCTLLQTMGGGRQLAQQVCHWVTMARQA